MLCLIEATCQNRSDNEKVKDTRFKTLFFYVLIRRQPDYYREYSEDYFKRHVALITFETRIMSLSTRVADDYPMASWRSDKRPDNQCVISAVRILERKFYL